MAVPGVCSVYGNYSYDCLRGYDSRVSEGSTGGSAEGVGSYALNRQVGIKAAPM